MSMWKKLRKEYTNYTLEDIGKMANKTRQAISRYELGEVKMPTELQIMYLGFRNNSWDKKIISYLKETEVR